MTDINGNGRKLVVLSNVVTLGNLLTIFGGVATAIVFAVYVTRSYDELDKRIALLTQVVCEAKPHGCATLLPLQLQQP